MTPARALRSAAPALALGAAALASCVHDSDGPSYSTPVLSESEPNDFACCPDYFGSLVPGELFEIHGFISDDGFDPFDGLAFTAAEPITVEFRLFADDPGADLDICLYDPALGAFVDCFQSPYNPEIGAAHVLFGGADFHLVVSSFVGASHYALEVNVLPLYADAAAELPAGAVASGAAEPHKALGAKPDRTEAFEAYLRPLATRDAREEPALFATATLTLHELDLDTGELRTTYFAETSEGQLFWMGWPKTADAK